MIVMAAYRAVANYNTLPHYNRALPHYYPLPDDRPAMMHPMSSGCSYTHTYLCIRLCGADYAKHNDKCSANDVSQFHNNYPFLAGHTAFIQLARHFEVEP